MAGTVLVAAALLAAPILGPLPAAAREEGEGVVNLGHVAVAPVIDGVLTPGEWDGAGRAELQYQVQPGDNVPASEPTLVYLAADAKTLYVAFHAFDSEPAGIRARVGRRDDVTSDDYVSMHLDTFDDRRRAYVFRFNPLGIQADGLYNEGTAVGRDWESNLDASWDGILVSKGRVDGEGFVVEAAIPFASLRYQAGPGRGFGLHLSRWVSRKAESIHWRPISRDVSSLLVQMGRITGLEGIDRRRGLDLIPELVGTVAGSRPPDGRLRNDPEAQPGLTATWAMTPNLTLSGAANPDFSQIEADVPQIDVNQRFPLFYPEKRPFFLEGDQYFRSLGALTFVNTRQIVDPDWGTKLAGKTGRSSLGLILSSDPAPGERAAPARAGAGRTRSSGLPATSGTSSRTPVGARSPPAGASPAPRTPCSPRTDSSASERASSVISSHGRGRETSPARRSRARRPISGTSGRAAICASSSTTSACPATTPASPASFGERASARTRPTWAGSSSRSRPPGG